MARIRNIKPEMQSNEKLSSLPEATHLLAYALLTYSDDYGYFNANASLVKAACSPLREPSVPIEESLMLLVQIDFIRLAEGCDGRRYGWIVSFEKHQRVHKPTASKIKPLVEFWQAFVTTDDGSPGFSRNPPDFPGGNGNGNGEQGVGSGKGSGSGKGKDVCGVVSKTRPTPPTASDAVAEIAPEDCKYPVYPTTPGATKKPRSWVLSDALLVELAETFPAVDVRFQARKAHGWVMANLTRRKTFDGMRQFLFGWMAREQDRAGSSAAMSGTKNVDPRGNLGVRQRMLDNLKEGRRES